MEYSSFFNSENGDRQYLAEDWDRHLKDLIKNGIFGGGTNLQVTADGSAMSVVLQPGKAWINGKHYENTQELTFQIAAADGTLNRIDRIVICLDYGARTIIAKVKKGIFASNAAAPDLQRNADKYELCLANISIPAGTSEISQSLITDTRLDTDVCGIVTGAVNQVDTATLYKQIQTDLAEFKSGSEAGFSTWSENQKTDFTSWSDTQKADFTAWLQTMKNIPPEDAAAYLQNQINALKSGKLDADEKGQPSGIASLDAYGHIPKEQLNLNFAGHLVVHVTAADSGGITGTRVRIRNEQLGANYVQSLDALGNTTFSLLDNHTYYVVLLDYPSQYYGAAATVTITGGETQELTLTLKTTPDIVGYKINVATGEVTYTDGAANFQPMTVKDGVYDAGSWAENWAADVKPCLLKNMVVQYYLKKTGIFLYDYEHQANGTSSDIRSGDDGDVVNEVPRAYYKFWDETEPDGTKYNCFKMAKEPQDDTWCCNAFLSQNGVPQETIYLGAYDGREYNGKLRSLSDVAPTVSKTIGEFRTLANANGAGYELRELAKDRYLTALQTLFFKGLDGQSRLGKGRTSSSGAINTGSMNDKPLFWGDQTGTSGMKFMGIENFWGNIYKFLDGMIHSSGTYHYKIHGPYNDSGSGYSTGPSIPASGYINKMVSANGYGMVPSETVSSEADSKYHDYSWGTSSGGPYILYVGGGWSDGVVAGPFCWNGFSASFASSGLGASLSATPQQ